MKKEVNWYQLGEEDVFRILDTDSGGLVSREAADRVLVGLPVGFFIPELEKLVKRRGRKGSK